MIGTDASAWVSHDGRSGYSRILSARSSTCLSSQHFHRLPPPNQVGLVLLSIKTAAVPRTAVLSSSAHYATGRSASDADVDETLAAAVGA